MGTLVPVVLDALVAACTAATPNDCAVVDTWIGATAYGKILTICSAPVIIDRTESGFDNEQTETIQVPCSLVVPPSDQNPSDVTPSSIRFEAAVVLDAIRVAINPDLADGVTHAWLGEDSWSAEDGSSGFEVTVLFTINVVTHI